MNINIYYYSLLIILFLIRFLFVRELRLDKHAFIFFYP